MKHAERTQRIKFFQRQNGRYFPTAEAKSVFEQIDGVFQKMDDLGHVLSSLERGGLSELRVASVPSISHVMVPRAIAQVRKRFPDLHLNINVLKIEEALNYLLLEKGECIAISYRFNHSGIDFEPLASGDLYCIVPINHPLATRNSIAAAEISRYFERTGLRTAGQMGGHKRPKLEPHREFLEACHAEKPDVTLQALCDRLLSERSVKADTSLMSRFLRRIGLTPKKRRSSPASRTVRT